MVRENFVFIFFIDTIAYKIKNSYNYRDISFVLFSKSNYFAFLLLGVVFIMAGFADMPHGTETILIVDDHDTIWDFLIEALQELGYLVLLAENGQDAVDI